MSLTLRDLIVAVETPEANYRAATLADLLSVLTDSVLYEELLRRQNLEASNDQLSTSEGAT